MIEKILLGIAAVSAGIFAKEGQNIPAAVFAILLITAAFLPVKRETKLILATATGFPLLLFAATPWTGAITLLFLMTGLFFIGNAKLCVKSGIAFGVCAALGGVIMYLPQVAAGLGIAAGIAGICAYCIFVRVFRMKKSLKIKVV